MPTYCFKCSCGATEEIVRPMSQSNDLLTCPVCKQEMSRNLQAERPNAQNDFTNPVYSEALGVHPSQVEEAKRRFPHHDFTADGRMMIRSTAERNRIYKDLGWQG